MHASWDTGPKPVPADPSCSTPGSWLRSAVALTRAAGRAGAAAALALLWLLLCAPGDAGCRFLTVASPLDRVTRHPGRIHSLSTALYTELENHFPPRDNELGKPARKCHTSDMLIPNGKEYAQRIPLRRRMQSMGINSNSLNGMASSEATGLSISNEVNMMSDSDYSLLQERLQ